MARRTIPPHDPPQEFIPPAGTRRLVALGDPHGALGRARAVVERERDAQTALCAVGDVVGYAPGERCSELALWLAAEGIPSVRGNHEDWMRRDGAMFLPGDRGDLRITPQALEEIERWPWDLQVRFEGLPGVRVTHSLHEGAYDWITRDNVESFARLLAGERFICIGHSHRPAIYRLAGASVSRTPFPFQDEPRLVFPIEDGCTYVLDCGSLARPEQHRLDRGFAWGTYGVVDFAAGTVELRRVR